MYKRKSQLDTRSVLDLLQKNGIHYEWNNSIKRFRTFSSIQNQKKESISWIRDRLPERVTMQCTNLVSDFRFQNPLEDIAIIKVEDPRYVFAMILEEFFARSNTQDYISAKSSVDKSVKIGKHCFIDDFVRVGKNCVIGENVRLYANVSLYDNVRIYDDVIIHSGTVIGADGYGYVKNKDGIYEKMPQLGGVVIERNVEIGANTCIDRGTIDDTIIGEGTKIDNLCHIAHNVIIGKNCMIVANSEISGSVILGDHVWIAPCVTIKEGIKIGDNSFIGFKSLVLEDVPPNSLAYGHPAKITIRE